MRLAAAVARLLSEELTTEECLRQVAVARIQAVPWDWIVLSVYPRAHQTLRTLLSALAPLRAGEVVITPGDGLGFYSPQGVIAQTVSPQDHTVQQILSDSPPEVQLAVQELDASRPVVFARLKRDSSLSDVHGLWRVVRDRTWFSFRSLPRRLRGRRLGFTLGAQTASITTLDYDPIAACENSDIHMSFFSSPAKSAVSVRILNPNGSMESLKLSNTQVFDALGVPLGRHYGFDVRLSLDVEIVSPHERLRRGAVIEAVKSCRSGLRAAREHCERLINARIDNTINLLEERRRQTRSRESVVILDKVGISRTIGSVPTNENEVLILAGKLEAYIGSVLPIFRIWEHTALVGIDALADIQLSRESAPLRYATVEFEFELGNFFRHSHPIRQTEFVVCWSTGGLGDGRHSYGNGRVDGNGALSFEMRTGDWIRVMDFGEHLIRVLVLRELPGLRVQKRTVGSG